MTLEDHQYWKERKKRIKLVNGAFEICKQKGLIAGKLIELLIAKYGKDSFVRMEDYEIENFRNWMEQK